MNKPTLHPLLKRLCLAAIAAALASLAFAGGAGGDGAMIINSTDGSAAFQTVTGGSNYQLFNGPGSDTIDGGAGIDRVDYFSATGGVTVNLGLTGVQHTGGGGDDTLSNVEDITGSNMADTITGNSGPNKIVATDPASCEHVTLH